MVRFFQFLLGIIAIANTAIAQDAVCSWKFVVGTVSKDLVEKKTLSSGQEFEIKNVSTPDIRYAMGVSKDVSIAGTAISCRFTVNRNSEGPAWLVVGAALKGNVCVNGQQVANLQEKPRFSYGRWLGQVNLKSGQNECSIEANCAFYENRISAIVFDTKEDADRYVVSRAFIYLPTLCFSKLPATAKFEVDGVAASMVKNVRVGGDMTPVRTDSSWSLNVEKSGFYTIVCETDKGELKAANFFAGDIAHAIDAVQVGQLTGENKTDLDANQKRWEALTKPEFFNPNDRDWMEKAIYTLKERELISRLAGTGQLLKGYSGLHIRAFKTAIDGSMQNYRIYYPITGKPVPLIIIMPTVGAADLPFIRSPVIANQKEADEVASVAESLGVAVLWPGYRGQPWCNAIDLSHIDEVLNNVLAGYNIDRTRIAIYGKCSGALMALSLAAERPSYYSCLWLTQGYFHRETHRYEPMSVKWGDEFAKWLKATDPGPLFLQNCDKPVVLETSDRDRPGHGERKFSDAFYQESQEFPAGKKMEVIHSPDSHLYMEWERVFRWCKEHASIVITNENHRFTPGFSNGPVSRVVSEPFVVVVGTAGSDSDKAGCLKILERFKDAWRRSTNGDLVVYKDTDVPKGALENNLVVIGTPRTNQLWQTNEKSIALKYDGSSLRFRKDSVDCKGAFQALAPSPFSANKTIVFIGASDMNQATYGTLELAQDGWYDYAVWNTVRRVPALQKAGYYSDRN